MTEPTLEEILEAQRRQLIKNLCISPILPVTYAPMVIRDLGGSFDISDAASKQGGGHPCNLKWENGEACSREGVFDLEMLKAYAYRNRMDFSLDYGTDSDNIVATVYKIEDDGVTFWSSDGKLFGSTLAASMIKVIHKLEHKNG